MADKTINDMTALPAASLADLTKLWFAVDDNTGLSGALKTYKAAFSQMSNAGQFQVDTVAALRALTVQYTSVWVDAGNRSREVMPSVPDTGSLQISANRWSCEIASGSGSTWKCRWK